MMTMTGDNKPVFITGGCGFIGCNLADRFAARGDKADEHGMSPQTYQWDMVSNKGELAKGGWAGQLLYVNREKDVVVAWFGTNQTANPPVEPLPCRMIANKFF